MVAKDIVERLHESADALWPQAVAVSNMNKPESDNNTGRACTAMREAADEIERLRKEIEGQKFKHATTSTKPQMFTVPEIDPRKI